MTVTGNMPREPIGLWFAFYKVKQWKKKAKIFTIFVEVWHWALLGENFSTPTDPASYAGYSGYWPDWPIKSQCYWSSVSNKPWCYWLWRLIIVMFHLSCWLRILFFCQMCVMVTDVKGTEDFQPWVLMSNELVMATCTVNNKSLQLTN